MRKASGSTPAGAAAPRPRWLMLIHHLPPRPDYLRVRIGRRLRQLGAVALKNSVYVLPATPAARAGLAPIAREILERGGEAMACEARFVSGLSDAAIEDRFREARDPDYARVRDRARALAASLRGRAGRESHRRSARRTLERLQRHYQATVARDPFGAGGREEAAGALSTLADLLEGVEEAAPARSLAPPRGATWVTRTGVMVDRIASAWLIRRAIDPRARFKFVPSRGHRAQPGEIRFDMAGAEHTHEGDRCTFEVLLDHFRIRDSSMRAIAEIVHDLDLGDQRFQRPEALGIGRAIVGIAIGTPDDAERLARGATLFDGLYQSFRSHARR